MTDDERTRQMELFEQWAHSRAYPLRKTDLDYEYGYTRAARDAWQACCEANGVGEPSDVEGLRQACRDLLSIVADAIIHGMPITPAVADARNRAVAALAKREERG